MSQCRRVISLLVFSLPLAAWAETPVAGNSAGYGYVSNGYPQAIQDASGAYAGGAMSTPTSAQGEMFLQLQQLQDEVSRLRGMVEEQQHEVRRLKQESLDRYQDLDSRLSAAASAPAQQQNAPAGAIDTGGTPVPAAAQAPASSGSADPEKEKLYYDAAFDLIKVKDFDKASQAFAAFLRKYPNSQYAGNAQYWLGEVNLAKGDLQGAGQAFARVSQNYPKHPKVPDSLYKLADVERRLGNAGKAKSALQQVVAQYPGSSAAQLAQRDLQSLR
ncbi:tol-pal system protein YbgF [Azotobacter beijerinckii]|uniref:Cell division coordinator CpoB n=1 Tax=Azotobacter beijerinckii TaxID=170623 RepID=A0A1I4D4H6_9GAMM|nr:tol-pal system protein YbgF [Azotobacter beijerinckii]SFB26761.1 tol-pal system protein YbgF [Azotobacter beijerinckii]SFK88478.1 tol-pal system protein YbgF [Azotobacter beijerinckii]